jgi:hypothetical protein
MRDLLTLREIGAEAVAEILAWRSGRTSGGRSPARAWR